MLKLKKKKKNKKKNNKTLLEMVSTFIKLIQEVDLQSLIKLETEHLKVWIKPLALSYANCVALDMLTSVFSSIKWE